MQTELRTYRYRRSHRWELTYCISCLNRGASLRHLVVISFREHGDFIARLKLKLTGVINGPFRVSGAAGRLYAEPFRIYTWFQTDHA